MTACGGGDEPTEGTTGASFLTREVVLSDYNITPGEIKVPANSTVRFIVRNDGDVMHEFRIEMDPPEVLEVSPKTKDRMDVVLDEPGEYEYACTIHEDDKLGMKGKLIVSPND